LKMSEWELLFKQQSANQTTWGLNLAWSNKQGVKQKGEITTYLTYITGRVMLSLDSFNHTETGTQCRGAQRRLTMRWWAHRAEMPQAYIHRMVSSKANWMKDV